MVLLYLKKGAGIVLLLLAVALLGVPREESGVLLLYCGVGREKSTSQFILAYLQKVPSCKKEDSNAKRKGNNELKNLHRNTEKDRVAANCVHLVAQAPNTTMACTLSKK
jgi:hypothetical protein